MEPPASFGLCAMREHRVVIDSGYLLEAVMPTNAAMQHDALDLISELGSGRTRAVVPWIFYAEIAAGCAKGVRSKRMTNDDAIEFMTQLTDLGIDIDMRLEGPLPMYENAMLFHAQAYDAIYVALAKAMDLPVATVDAGMKTAVLSMKLPIYRG